jgi:multisubunit Na+/H+ antiporter MnhG subunit
VQRTLIIFFRFMLASFLLMLLMRASIQITTEP